MNKTRMLFALLMLLLFAGCSLPNGMPQIQAKAASIIPAAYEDEKNISVYFCPREECGKHLGELIISAKEYVHCGFFELNNEEVVNALIDRAAKIDVRVVVDGDNYEEVADLSFVKAEKDSNYMHNKFCVIDGEWVSSGSFNPTYNCDKKNNNNLIIVRSVNLAQNYEDEFNELWGGVYGKGSNVGVPIVYLNRSKVENYFCPEDECGDRIADAIMDAKESVKFMAFSFTHDGIANALLLKMQDGVSVSGVFEKRGANAEYSKYKVLDYQGADVRLDNNSAVMHHKVFIIDDSVVVTGSFNPSANADKYNDENVLIIHDKETANRYLSEFEYVRDNYSTE